MKVVVNPKYDHLRSRIEQLPFSFEKEGRVIYKGRNIVKVFSLDNNPDVNVKRYRKPNLFNRIVYTFFRKSKAFRAYCNGLRIVEKGFDTAESVAYIEMYKNGLLHESFYISLQCTDVREMREYYFASLHGNEGVIEAFARYSASLHDAGIYHLDYSPGNILIHNDDTGKYTFMLVDTNRMKFMPVSPAAGCRNFARLFDNDDVYRYIGMVYSQSRKEPFSQDEAVRLIMKYKDAFLHKKSRKEKIKRFFRH